MKLKDLLAQYGERFNYEIKIKDLIIYGSLNEMLNKHKRYHYKKVSQHYLNNEGVICVDLGR